MRSEDEYWIVMEASDCPGCYIVPGSGLQEGWDEALPASAGSPDLDKGAYWHEGAIDLAIAAIRKLGVLASRIDSDARAIATFTNWKSVFEQDPKQ